MTEQNRRGFLKVAGVGVAAAGVAVTQAGPAAAAALPAAAKREILVHVLDVDKGTISLMVEGHEVTVTDRDLAARIAQARHTGAARSTR